MTVQGFGGMRIDNGRLKIEPHLPDAWKSLKYQIQWQGNTVKVSVDNENLVVETIGNGIEFINHGQTYQVAANSNVAVATSVEELV